MTRVSIWYLSCTISVFQSSCYVLNHDVNNSRIDSLAILGAKVVLFFEISAQPLQNLSFKTLLSQLFDGSAFLSVLIYTMSVIVIVPIKLKRVTIPPL